MDINASLSQLAKTASECELRRFACNYCRRLIPSFPDMDLEELILFGEGRCLGEKNQELLVALRSRFGEIYDSLYPGYGDPPPKALALSAVGEVAFTDSTLNAAINALEFSADAIAKKAAAAAPDTEYDTVYDASYATERSVQSEMLQRSFGN